MYQIGSIWLSYHIIIFFLYTYWSIQTESWPTSFIKKKTRKTIPNKNINSVREDVSIAKVKWNDQEQNAFCFDLIANRLFQAYRATETINAELSIDLLFYGEKKKNLSSTFEKDSMGFWKSKQSSWILERTETCHHLA